MTSPDHVALGIHHIKAIVRGMNEVAKLDGVHDAEAAMLKQFYGACATDAGALTSFRELVDGPFDIADAARVLETPEHKAVFLRSCILLAYADGRYSQAERDKVRSFADGLGIPAAATLALEEAVADQLLQNIARISNVDALKEVASETMPK